MEGCKQMGHFLNSSNYRETLILSLKVDSPKTKKTPAARGAQKCLRVIYTCHNPSPNEHTSTILALNEL